ncbi:MAG: hypothetical protein J2P55_03635 [Rhizobiales bacterium]|nr:hypothetical protein [Hyphomicrobiales bacterium]
MFPGRLFAVRASVQASMVFQSTVPLQVLMVSGPTAPGRTEKAVPSPEALASALVDLSEAGLERLQAAKR